MSLAKSKEEFKTRLEEIMELIKLQPEKFNYSLELELDDCSGPETFTADFTYRHKTCHENPYGAIHGGVVASIFDTCIGIGAFSVTHKMVTSTDLSVSYLRALVGSEFSVHVEFTHIGGRMVSGTGIIRDKKTGEICASCMSSYLVLDERPKGMWI